MYYLRQSTSKGSKKKNSSRTKKAAVPIKRTAAEIISFGYDQQVLQDEPQELGCMPVSTKP